jgi:hypothetical protein
MLSLLLAMTSNLAHAGGGPASVLVLHNALDPESIEIAEYYADARDIPPGQLCRVSGVDPAALTISYTDFEAHIQTAFRDCMDTLPDPDEIDYIVVTRGLPLRVDIESGFHTSLQAMLQVGDGIRTSDGAQIAGLPQAFSGGTAYATVYNPLWPGSGGTSVYPIENTSASRYGTGSKLVTLETQPRAFSRAAVGYSGGFDLSGEMFLVSRLDGFDALDALDLVDRAIAGDGSFPEAPITCMAAADSARGARDPECAYVVQMLDGAGISAQWIDAHDPSLSGVEMSAYLTGTTSLQEAIDGNTYVPGAFACNLTSYGAVPNNFVCDEAGAHCPASESQTSIARLVRGGVTGAHGTVAEPLNNSFPGAGMLLLYTMGYNMIESAQITQVYLYWQNIYLGDPLSSPWAERPEVTLSHTDEVPVNRPLAVVADHPAGVAELRLYVDGARVATETGDWLEHTLEGVPGDTLDILAIAVSEHTVVSRPGWPTPETLARPEIQGWTTTRIRLGPPASDVDTGQPEDTGETSSTDDTGDIGPDGDEKPEGCACSTIAPSTTWWAGLIALIGWRRQRS